MKYPEPTGLIRTGENSWCQRYPDFYLLFQAGDTLEVFAKAGPPPEGVATEEARVRLPEGFELSLTGNKKGFLLKRLSNQNQWKEVLSITACGIEIGDAGRISGIQLRGHCTSRYIWGTGERYHQVNQRGSCSTGRVTEKFTQQGEQTYLPVPFFMTEEGIGWFREGSIPVSLDFQEGFTLSQAVQGDALFHDSWFFGPPDVLLGRMIARTGAPVMPPDWAFGVWISANGWDRDAEVEAQLEALRRYGYPADVMVLEAWSDERTFYRWNDAEHWADPEKTIHQIREAGLHPVLWQIPVIKQEREGEPGALLQADEQEVISRKLCVLREDGTPYRIPEGTWFAGSLLPDFTNPETLSWWFDRRKYLLEMGIEGFKTDGGEFLLEDTVRLHNGMTGLEAHNAYPAQYIEAYHRFMTENGRQALTFSRADSTGAQTRPLHWAGDQLSTWEELQAQLRAGITAGLSGVLFWGFDIGGFAGELPEAELYLRATAMGCFSPIMQWHAEPRSGQFYTTHEDGFNNDRSPWNLAEKLGEPRVLEIGVRFARLRKRLQPYLIQEARYCVKSGRPLMAHLCLDFPFDEHALACEDQYMLGRRLMVCPITAPGQAERELWLPEGCWRHGFTGQEYEGGQRIRLSCPLEEIIVLERRDQSGLTGDSGLDGIL